METLKKILCEQRRASGRTKSCQHMQNFSHYCSHYDYATTLIIQHTEQLNEHRTQERAEPNGSNVGRRGDAA